jgi:hypothetical protein
LAKWKSKVWVALFPGNRMADGAYALICALILLSKNLIFNIAFAVGSFVVHNRTEFVKHIMPAFFRMSKYESFQRQLNLYGFNRITAGRDKGGK